MCDSCVWKECLERIAEVQTDLELLPDRAEDFVASCLETLESIASWIEENEHVTPGQEQAVENIAAGAEKWQR